MKLKIIIEKDESGYFVAEVPALPGCFSQGKTIIDAKANIKEAIAGWLEVMNNEAKTEQRKIYEEYKKLVRVPDLNFVRVPELFKNFKKPAGKFRVKKAPTL